MSGFRLTTEVDRDYVIFRTDGYINNLGGEKIEREFEANLKKGYRKFIINFEKTELINSIGISILIGVIEKILESEGKLYFSNLSPVNAEIFEIMGLTKYVPIFNTDEEAKINI